jgi:uncharacterized protein YgiB involved in biofilm formation
MTRDRARWRSEAVSLALVGATTTAMATGLAGCGRETFQRNIYASEAECLADYSPAACWTGGAGREASGRYNGPVYRLSGGLPRSCKSGDPGPGRSWGAQPPKFLAKQAVQRGGFGVSSVQCSSSSRSRSYWGS